jgi:acyl-CoA reductase-like NAD-dependent aldehyde dehydrogenase
MIGRFPMVTTEEIYQKQREFFETGLTRDVSFRLAKLQKLKAGIMAREQDLYEALALDLGKSVFEAYTDEIGFALGEIDYAVKHLQRWAKPKGRFPAPLFWPGSAKVVPEPYGVALIMAPWNYPLQLIISPLVGAISAGNCSVVKASHLSVNTNKVIKEVIEDNFEEEYISFIEAGPARTTRLLESPFDVIFYTGSSRVGKSVMEAAAKNLTPVVLELGGKSPCIVTESSDLETSARRILWGKFVNAGQTCIAPDYLLVQESIHSELVEAMKKVLVEFYGEDPSKSSDYGRIINKTHLKRITSLIKGDVVAGGTWDDDKLYVAPTIIDNVSWDDEIMEEEIFGPVLPVLEFTHIEEVISRLKALPEPLALYLFTKDRELERKVLDSVSSGGVCINHTLLHATPPGLPFGGVGNSGMGAYHGKYSFNAFTHYRSVMKKSFAMDNTLFYPPYIRIDKWVKKIMGWLG